MLPLQCKKPQNLTTFGIFVAFHLHLCHQSLPNLACENEFILPCQISDWSLSCSAVQKPQTWWNFEMWGSFTHSIYSLLARAKFGIQEWAHNVLGAKFHIDRFLHPWGAKTLNLNLTVCKFSILSWPHLAAQWQSWTRCRTTKLPLPTISNPFLNSSSLMAISVRKLYRSKVWQERNKRNIEFF